MVDGLWSGLTDMHIKTPMGITAENLAEKYEITRDDTDNYAVQTQKRWDEGSESISILKIFENGCNIFPILVMLVCAKM